MTTLVIILAACIAAIALMVWRAPEGWEDSEGFHYGRPGDEQ